MEKLFKPIDTLFEMLNQKLSIFALTMAVVLSVTAWYHFYLQGLTTTYNDAMSHLNLSRLVIDNTKTGLSQIGGVWLPLSHILPLPLIWNDWAWHSGFAGSIYSMLAYVVSTMGIYKVVREFTHSKLASLIGALAFALNLNILYLQSTPLTEPLYIVFFVLSILFLIKWFKEEKATYLPILGLLGFLQVIARYDGWFVVGIEGIVIFLHQVIYKREQFTHALGKLLLYGLPVGLGFGLWFLWNLLIFNDPLFFALGPYSARAQQATIENRAGLITKGSLPHSLIAYWFATLSNVGIFTTLLSLIGLFALFFAYNSLKLSQKALFFLALFSPILFNILALFLGFSILNLPQLNWNPSSDPSGQWFNVRYGILALPTAAVLIGLLAGMKKIIMPLLAAIIISIQIPLMYTQGIITVIDGTIGSSSFANSDVSSELARLVGPEEKILMSTSFFNAVAFKSERPLKHFIHEGASEEWSKAIVSPENYAKWLVVANGDVGEPVHTSLIKNQQGRFLGLYSLVYKGKHANIYKLKEEDELFVRRENNSLKIGDKPFEVVGVNSYDLAYMYKDEIDKTFQSLESAGVNTVRFWAFGDGFEEGFQPEAGLMNEARFKNLDYILASARKHHIRLIPTLVNNWSDYGGKEQYLIWTGKNSEEDLFFFTDQQIIGLFKNYINNVISRQNKITDTSYAVEPAIFAWEIINEPRITNGDVDEINGWADEIASYIKTIDPNHLVSIGTERVVAEQPGQPSLVCSSSKIDICSFHLYLYHEDELLLSSQKEVENLIQIQAHYAATENKPLLLGEFGIPKNYKPFGADPQDVLSTIVESSWSHKYAGYLIWNWSTRSDDTFGFSPTGDESGKYNLSELEKILN